MWRMYVFKQNKSPLCAGSEFMVGLLRAFCMVVLKVIPKFTQDLKVRYTLLKIRKFNGPLFRVIVTLRTKLTLLKFGCLYWDLHSNLRRY